MARQIQPVEVNKFNAGLITDANPLTTPENSSLDEINMVLNIDGSRNRRLGMDYEAGHEIITTDISGADTTNVAITTHRWDNAGGDPEKSIEVVQTGNQIKFFSLDYGAMSEGLLHTVTLDPSLISIPFSYAVVDGLLVVATSEKVVRIYEYDEDVITETATRLLIRDLFGVEDVVDGIDITRSSDVQYRPKTHTSTHVYNLRNQSWGIPRIDGASSANIASYDPIEIFRGVSGNQYPSNADSVVEALYPDPENDTGRTIDRFFAQDIYRNPLGSGRAAQGYYIIDALDRGASRILQDQKNHDRYASLTYEVVSLPVDSTPKGARTVAEFAGRVFYSGFPGIVQGGDRHSPKMSSYILFSKVVDSIADISLCYQEGDPTAKDNADIIDTDGGFVRINEAYDIQKLINLGDTLMVIAANGVWAVRGSSDKGFTATNYIVDKITDRGCASFGSIVQMENAFFYWGEDALYSVGPDEYGAIRAQNISFGRIQKLYDSIPIEDKINVRGGYDSYERKARWVYYNRLNNDEDTMELVLDTQLQAFYLNRISKLGGNFPRVAAIFIGRPYALSSQVNEVIAGVEDVLVGTEDIVVSTTSIVSTAQREIGYVVVTAVAPTLQYTFASYRNRQFRDWFSANNIGVDAEAYVITCYMSGGDFMRGKQIPYIFVHSKRTETGYDADMNPVNPSSVIMQAQWNWANSPKSGKWGRETQAYRYRRQYLPYDETDDYDNGFATVVSKNKLRGSGKVVSLKFSTEPDKDFNLYGWSMLFSVAEMP